MRYFQRASCIIDIIRIQHSGVTRCSLEKLVRQRTFLKLHILVFTDQVTAVLAPVMSKIDIVISFFDDLIVMLYHKQCILLAHLIHDAYRKVNLCGIQGCCRLIQNDK